MQNIIQLTPTPVRTAHISVHMIVHNCVTQHSTKQFPIIFPLMLQTIIIAQMLSYGGEGMTSITFIIVVTISAVTNNDLLTVFDRHVIVWMALNWLMCRRKYSGALPHLPVTSSRP